MNFKNKDDWTNESSTLALKWHQTVVINNFDIGVKMKQLNPTLWWVS
jgi:hypothetical protein